MKNYIPSISDNGVINLGFGNPQKTIQWKNTIGRVTKTDGGLIYFTTPHGTTIKMGFVPFIDGVKPVVDRVLAASYIKDIRSKGKKAFEFKTK